MVNNSSSCWPQQMVVCYGNNGYDNNRGVHFLLPGEDMYEVGLILQLTIIFYIFYRYANISKEAIKDD